MLKLLLHCKTLSPQHLSNAWPVVSRHGGTHVSLCDWSVQDGLEQRLQAAGGVSSNIVEAFRAVLEDSSLDGAFVSAAITLPASTELRDDIPNLNPVLLYQVR